MRMAEVREELDEDGREKEEREGGRKREQTTVVYLSFPL